MKTKLSIWQARDLTLYGRSMLAKTVGASQLIYAASMMTVPETVIHKTQTELFAFLWKNKKDKIKRQVVCQPTSEGGLNFIDCGTMVKSLRLSWIARLLEDTYDNRKKIPNYYFNRYGGLSFLQHLMYRHESPIILPRDTSIFPRSK